MPEILSNPLRSRFDEAASSEIESIVLPLWRAAMSDRKIGEHLSQRYRWLYQEAPAGPARTWIIRDPQSSRVVAAGSVLPVDYLVAGRPVRAGLLIDLVVSPESRTAGPAVMLQREIARLCSANGFAFLFGYPNRRAWPVMVRAGYRALCYSHTWVRPMQGDVDAIRRSVLLMTETQLSRIVPKGWSQRIAQRFADVSARAAGSALWLFDRSVRLLGYLGRFQMAVGELNGDSPVVDAQAQAKISRIPTNGYPQWRFLSHPTQCYERVVFSRRDRVIAWAIIRRNGDHAEIQDAAWSGSWPGAAWWFWLSLPAALSQAGFRRMSVCLAGEGGIKSCLQGAFYLRRNQGRNLVLHVPDGCDAELANALREPRNWGMFAGELDI
jgi:GNAT superfamily N-acetyltransferase